MAQGRGDSCSHMGRCHSSLKTLLYGFSVSILSSGELARPHVRWIQLDACISYATVAPNLAESIWADIDSALAVLNH